jgi:hypothetical protein
MAELSKSEDYAVIERTTLNNRLPRPIGCMIKHVYLWLVRLESKKWAALGYLQVFCAIQSWVLRLIRI